MRSGPPLKDSAQGYLRLSCYCPGANPTGMSCLFESGLKALKARIDSTSIRQRRIERAWTQEHLADAAGVSVKTVQRIEAGRWVSAETRQAIAASLNLKPEALLFS
jgi:DNA-binding XRE family transcriptional regulator